MLTYEISHAVTIGEEINDPTISTYSCESMCLGVLDSGAPHSVCGSKWLKCYISTLSDKNKRELKYESTNNYYKFGCGRNIKAEQKVTIPAVIGDKNILIRMDIVEGELPLLLSRPFMKKTKADLNFEDDTIHILGQKLNLILTRSGHYALPLGKNIQISEDLKRNPDVKLTLHAENISPMNIVSDKYVAIEDRNDEVDKLIDYTVNDRLEKRCGIKEIDFKLDINSTDQRDQNKPKKQRRRRKRRKRTSIENKSDRSPNNTSAGLPSLTTSEIASNHPCIETDFSLDTKDCLAKSEELEAAKTTVKLKNEKYNNLRCGVKDNNPSMLPIFASDGLVDLKKKKVISICEKLPTNEFISLVKQVAAENGGLNRDFWLSVGNFEAALKNNTKNTIENDSRCHELIKEVVKNILSEVECFEKDVSAAGGRIFLITLIPCPSLVDSKKSIYSEKVQKLCSRIFIRLNQEIYMFNRKRNQGTIGIHKYLEVKRKKSFGKCGYSRKQKIIQHESGDFYPGRDQRKINLSMFIKDNTRLTKSATELISSDIMKEQKKKQEACDC